MTLGTANGMTPSEGAALGGPVVLGLALSRLGFDGLYLALAGVVVLSAALYHRVHGRTDTGRGLVAAAGANRPAQPRA